MSGHEFKSKWICADMTVKDRFSPVFRKDFSVSKTFGRVTAEAADDCTAKVILKKGDITKEFTVCGGIYVHTFKVYLCTYF